MSSTKAFTISFGLLEGHASTLRIQVRQKNERRKNIKEQEKKQRGISKRRRDTDQKYQLQGRFTYIRPQVQQNLTQVGPKKHLEV